MLAEIKIYKLMSDDSYIKTITHTPFFNIVTVLYNFANWDTIVRLNRSVGAWYDNPLKLVAIMFNLPGKTSWNNVRSNLKDIGEDKVITVLNDFFSTIESHKLKRNKVSHEGLLKYKTLDYHHLTCVWTQSHKDYNQENQHPELTEGTKENKEFLASKKEDFIKELDKTTNEITCYIVSLFDLLLPQLIKTIPSFFMEKHREHLKDLSLNDIDKYLLNDN